MAKKSGKPVFFPVDADDLKPMHQWHRPLQAPGITQVDFEERVDFRRLHRYRLARTRQSLAKSGLGAMLCFDQHNIRYISSTVIGEWARDKLIRYCLLTGTGDPWVWDFGSAARHHRIYCPWLKEDHVRAGNPGMRGAMWNPRFAWHAAEELGAEAPYAPKYMACHPKLRPQIFPNRKAA